MAKPWQSRQEMLVDIALETAISDPETIRQIRPAVPQQLFPQSRGMIKQEPTLDSIFNMSRYGVSYRSWVSGMPVMQNYFNQGEFSGSGRYSMNSLGGA
jgi:hypothetical protein